MKFELIQQELLKEASRRRDKASTKSSHSKAHRKLIQQAEGIELSLELMLQIIVDHDKPKPEPKPQEKQA